jgi:hypothetical protein
MTQDQMMGVLLCFWIASIGTVISYFWYKWLIKKDKMRNYMRDFTLAEGIDVQTRQLKDWERLLKPEVFADLKAQCEEMNKTATDGDSVFRGSDMNNYIANYYNGK